MESDGDGQDRFSFARRNGVSVNKEGGYYCRGRQYGVEKKLAVGDCYEYKKQLWGGRPNLMEIAREHKVSKMFVGMEPDRAVVELLVNEVETQRLG